MRRMVVSKRMVVLVVVLLKIVVHWAVSCFKKTKKACSYMCGLSHRGDGPVPTPPAVPSLPPQNLHRYTAKRPASYPCITTCRFFRDGDLGEGKIDGQTRQPVLVCASLLGCLLRSTSPFPYFMLVAFEGGSVLRAFILLLSYPFLWILHHLLDQQDVASKAMAFISFCGLRPRDVDVVSRAVLPKFFLEDLNAPTFRLVFKADRRMVLVSSFLPKVMVEGFLRDYIGVNVVVAYEMQLLELCGGRFRFYTGLPNGVTQDIPVSGGDTTTTKRTPDLGLGCDSNSTDIIFLSLCKEAYVVTEDTRSLSAALPRDQWPKPLVFHDGRLAMFPTPLASLGLFLWLPLGLFLALIRVQVNQFLPYCILSPVNAALGVVLRVQGSAEAQKLRGSGHVLYACNHRTLLDPVAISAVLLRPVPAVTYSLSRVSELLSPILTVRLARDRARDAATILRLLSLGDLVICPEGTTCREPYLLRFSPLFAELTDRIVPVALRVEGQTAFYGSTASGRKCLDPLFFLMNHCPQYWIHFLPMVPPERTCVRGGLSSRDVVNAIQEQLGAALGFQCTRLTRKHKYLMLAGNEGFVGKRGETAATVAISCNDDGKCTTKKAAPNSSSQCSSTL